MATKQELFCRLKALPPDDPYWRNRWMFTQPVFANESRQGADAKQLWLWASVQSTALQNHINGSQLGIRQR